MTAEGIADSIAAIVSQASREPSADRPALPGADWAAIAQRGDDAATLPRQEDGAQHVADPFAVPLEEASQVAAGAEGGGGSSPLAVPVPGAAVEHGAATQAPSVADSAEGPSASLPLAAPLAHAATTASDPFLAALASSDDDDIGDLFSSAEVTVPGAEDTIGRDDGLGSGMAVEDAPDPFSPFPDDGDNADPFSAGADSGDPFSAIEGVGNSGDTGTNDDPFAANAFDDDVGGTDGFDPFSK
eukprot:COSAG01_NODE_9509_length_2426_cov_2.358401_3_plen_243_part_00